MSGDASVFFDKSVIQFLIFIAIGDDLVVDAKHRGNEALLV
jgi:hypothetical protein